MRKRSRLVIAAAIPAFIAFAAGGGRSASAADRESLIKEFPADVQKLFTPDIPDAVIEALLKVRKAGASTFVLNDFGGELYKGQQLAYLKNWEAITGWTIKDIAPSPNPGQVKAQVDSGHPQFDLFETGSNGDAIEEEQSGLLAKLDMGLLNPLIAKFPNDGYQHTELVGSIQFLWGIVDLGSKEVADVRSASYEPEGPVRHRQVPREALPL